MLSEHPIKISIAEAWQTQGRARERHKENFLSESPDVQSGSSQNFPYSCCDTREANVSTPQLEIFAAMRAPFFLLFSFLPRKYAKENYAQIGTQHLFYQKLHCGTLPEGERFAFPTGQVAHYGWGYSPRACRTACRSNH